VVSLGKGGDDTVAAADTLAGELGERGIETIYDDREAGAGEKLTDAELLGCPLRIVVGKRTLAEGEVEAQERASGVDHRLPLAEAASRTAEILDRFGGAG
jgi:prolyl-tRNA synthetase